MDVNQTLIYTILLLTSSLYAIFLQSEPGKWLCENRAWMTVAGGVGYTVAAIAFLPLDWPHLVAAFAVAGTPIVARSLYNEWRRER